MLQIKANSFYVLSTSFLRNRYYEAQKLYIPYILCIKKMFEER
mgnify:CR=1 FL=1